MQRFLGNIFPRYAERRSNSPSRFGLSKVVRKLESPTTGRILELTKNDVRQLKILWHANIRRIIPQNSGEFSCGSSDYIWLEVFRNIFSANPRLKSVFGWADINFGSTDDERKNDFVLMHCELFGNLWHEIVSTLIRKGVSEMEHEEMIFKIRQVGSAHSRNSAVSFDAESWLCFKNALLDTFCPENGQFYDSRNAWNKVLTFTFSEMKQAFLQGITRRHSHHNCVDKTESTDSLDALAVAHKRAKSEKIKPRKAANRLRAPNLDNELAPGPGPLTKSHSAYFSSSGPFQRIDTSDSLCSADQLSENDADSLNGITFSNGDKRSLEIPVISVTLF